MGLFDPAIFDTEIFHVGQVTITPPATPSVGYIRPEPTLRGLPIIISIPLEVNVKEWIRIILPLIQHVSAPREALVALRLGVGSVIYSSIKMVERIGGSRIQEAKIKVRSFDSGVAGRLKQLNTLKKLFALKSKLEEEEEPT